MTDKPLVSIIIANYNGEDYLGTCLKSVLLSSYKKFELLIVDDGSTDKSLEILDSFAKQDNRLKIFTNGKNLGAAASRNAALAKAKGEIILFLDNDTEVTVDWIGGFLRVFDEQPDAGAAQSLLLDFNRRNLIQMAGGVLSPQTGWLLPFYQWEEYRKIKNKLTPFPIIGVSAALAVKKEVIVKIGGFDEKEGIHTEDLDFCWRIWIAGFKIYLAPTSIVLHRTKSLEEREKMNATLDKVYFSLAKNSMRSMIKNYELVNLLKYLPASFVINFGRGLLYLASKKSAAALRGTIKGVVWNLLNFFDTFTRRKQVQASRKFSDEQIFTEAMSRNSFVDQYRKYFTRGNGKNY